MYEYLCCFILSNFTRNLKDHLNPLELRKWGLVPFKVLTTIYSRSIFRVNVSLGDTIKRVKQSLNLLTILYPQVSAFYLQNSQIPRA